MHPFCSELLQYSHSLLLDGINISPELLKIFLERLVLTERQAEVISSHTNPRDRTDAFLYYIKRCPTELNPYLLLKSFLETSCPLLDQALKDGARKPDFRQRLCKQLRTETCHRCLILRYTDCIELLEELHKNRVIEAEVFSQCQSWIYLPEEWQVERLLEILAIQACKKISLIRDCISRVLSGRSPSLAETISKMDPGDMFHCRCMATQASRAPYALMKAPAVDSLRPGTVLPGDKVHSLTKIVVNMLTLQHHSRWHQIQLYTHHLIRNWGSDVNVMALLTALKVAVLHHTGQNKACMDIIPSFQKDVRGATNSTLLRLYFTTVKVSVYRSMGLFDEARGVVHGALQAAQLLHGNPALAPLQEAYAVNILHKVEFGLSKQGNIGVLWINDVDGSNDNDVSPPNIAFPSYEAIDEALHNLQGAYEVYRQLAASFPPELSFGFHLFGLGSLILSLFTRLGTCMAGWFVHPGGVKPTDLGDIEQIILLIRQYFPRIPRPSQGSFLLAESDYNLRLAEMQFSRHLPGVEQHLAAAKEKAEEAQTISKMADLPEERIFKYAQRRIDVIDKKYSLSWLGMLQEVDHGSGRGRDDAFCKKMNLSYIQNDKELMECSYRDSNAGRRGLHCDTNIVKLPSRDPEGRSLANLFVPVSSVDSHVTPSNVQINPSGFASGTSHIPHADSKRNCDHKDHPGSNETQSTSTNNSIHEQLDSIPFLSSPDRSELQETDSSCISMEQQDLITGLPTRLSAWKGSRDNSRYVQDKRGLAHGREDSRCAQGTEDITQSYEREDSGGHARDREDTRHALDREATRHAQNRQGTRGHAQDRKDTGGHAQDREDTRKHAPDSEDFRAQVQGRGYTSGNAQDREDTKHAQDREYTRRYTDDARNMCTYEHSPEASSQLVFQTVNPGTSGHVNAGHESVRSMELRSTLQLAESAVVGCRYEGYHAANDNDGQQRFLVTAENVEIHAPTAEKEKVKRGETSPANSQTAKYVSNKQLPDWPAATKCADASHGSQDSCLAAHGESSGISLHLANDAVGQLCNYMESMPYLASPDHFSLPQTPADSLSNVTGTSPRRSYHDKEKLPPRNARRPSPCYQDIGLQAQMNANHTGAVSDDRMSGSSNSISISLHSEHSELLSDTGSIPYLASPHRSELQSTTSSHLQAVSGRAQTGINGSDVAIASGNHSVASLYEMQLDFSETYASSTNQSNTSDDGLMALDLPEAIPSPRAIQHERTIESEHHGSPDVISDTPEREEVEGINVNSTDAVNDPTVAEQGAEGVVDKLVMDYGFSPESI